MSTKFHVMGYKIDLLKVETLKEVEKLEIEHERRYNEQAVRAKGRADGERNFPPPAQEDFSPYEQELIHAASKFASQIVSRYKAALEQIDAKIKTEREYFETRYRDMRENAEALFRQEESSVQNSHSLKDGHNFLELTEKRYRAFTERLGRPPVRHIPIWLYVILAFAIFVGEIPLNALVFEIFGENQVMTWIMAVVVGLAVPLGAHFVGIKVREHGEKFSPGNALKALLVTAVVLTALYGLSVLRQVYLGEIQGDIGISEKVVNQSIMFFWLNAALFFVATSISYLSHDSVPGFDESEKEFHRARKLVERLEHRRIKILRKFGLEKVHALNQANQEYREGMTRVNMMYGAYDQILVDGQEHEDRCVERLRREMSHYRDQNLAARTDNAVPKSFSKVADIPLKLIHFEEKLKNADFELPGTKQQEAPA